MKQRKKFKHWRDCKPTNLASGDVIFSDESIELQWPPDGTRWLVPGTFRFNEEVEFGCLDPGSIALIISVRNTSWKIDKVQTYVSDCVVLARGRLWWLQCPISSSKC